MVSQGEYDLENSVDTSQACGSCRLGKEEGDFLFCEWDAEVGSYAQGTWSCTRSDCVWERDNAWVLRWMHVLEFAKG